MGHKASIIEELTALLFPRDSAKSEPKFAPRCIFVIFWHFLLASLTEKSLRIKNFNDEESSSNKI